MEEKKFYNVTHRINESGEGEITAECVTVVNGQERPICEVNDSSDMFDVVLRFGESGEGETTTECVTVVDGQERPICEVIDSSDKAYLVTEGMKRAMGLFARTAIMLMEKEGNIDEATADAIRRGEYKE